ncbi:FeoA family protein [Cylindrospermum sp. FACHB-282]|uniref:FeoA family protein n=1 Tax=Cylindrospermum sp. FACHB-282 TaxID=2692794 RepID=UPI001686091A|nr:FeoA family protein [Cylindrospermum sp. FACHB-282]MBD2385281.1 ferrous iron transport protein A [Cylindrospermum sp. FACHB-282]
MYTPFSIIGCSLELLKPGERGIVIFSKSQDETIRRKLILMGISSGTNITLEQAFPAGIIKRDNIYLTIDRETARAIYVRIIN